MDRPTIRLLFVIAAFILAGIYLFVLSEGGALERSRLKNDIRAIVNENGLMKSNNDALLNMNDGERDGTPTHEDLLNSGYVKSGDKIIVIKDRLKESASARSIDTPGDDGSIIVYRIIWGIVSISVFMLLYFLWRKASPDAI